MPASINKDGTFVEYGSMEAICLFPMNATNIIDKSTV